MNYIKEYLSYDKYNIGDLVLIEYWYNSMITIVKIVNINGRKYEISHNVEQSDIQNAPNEILSKSDIIDFYRKRIKL